MEMTRGDFLKSAVAGAGVRARAEDRPRGPRHQGGQSRRNGIAAAPQHRSRARHVVAHRALTGPTLREPEIARRSGALDPLQQDQLTSPAAPSRMNSTSLSEPIR